MLRRGALEVQTDLLLGVDDVPLPVGVALVHASELLREPRVTDRVTDRVTPRSSTHAVPAATASNRFDSALFAAKPGVDGSRIEVPRVESPRVESPRIEPARAASAPSAAPQSTSVPHAAPSSARAIANALALPSGDSASARLAALAEQHLTQCPCCAQRPRGTPIFFGEGPADAELMIVTESPSPDDDANGRAFAGAAGDKLNEMLAAMGLRRDEVYLSYVLKTATDGGTGNAAVGQRAPTESELAACGSYLFAQCAIIAPKAIVTLGGPASKFLIDSPLGISLLRGTQTTITVGGDGADAAAIQVLPTYHLAYLLRHYTPQVRREMWSDLKNALALLGRSVPVKSS